MSEAENAPEPAPTGMPRWKKILLALAFVCIVLGLVLEGVGNFGDPAPDRVASSSGTADRSALVAGSVDSVESAPESAPDGFTAFAPLFLKGGFSFLIAFAIGSVIRTFVKLGLLLLGVVALGAMLLSYFEVITIDWVDLEGQSADIMRLGKGRIDDFTRFITGSLPSTAAALGGLFVGFKRS